MRSILIGAFALAASASYAETVVGAVASSGLGEGKLAPYLEQRFTSGRFRLGAQGELSRKIESGKGYRLGADVDWFGPVILHASFRHRDGGSWTKRGVWGGLGIGNQSARLLVRQEIGHNSTTALAGTLQVKPLEFQATGYRYRQGTEHRFGATLMLAMVF
jgi:hypothetical protein